MSRQLPLRPNLEHLRKQAKDLLQELQQRDPAARLADAQHTLAREYGFASWPKMKARLELEAAARPASSSPFSGRWNANRSKSQPHPANEFVSATIEFAIAGDSVTITDVVVDRSGREERRVNTIRADGREHAAEGGNGYSLVTTWRASHVLETVAKKDGEVVGAGMYQVSADGQTLTITADQMRVVLDRAEDDSRAV
jgi:hypothetical protein